MKKKERLFYERPQLEVVELCVTQPLLDGSVEAPLDERTNFEEITTNPFAI